MKFETIITLIGLLILIMLSVGLILEDSKLEHCIKTVNLEGEVINFTCENIRDDNNGNETYKE